MFCFFRNCLFLVLICLPTYAEELLDCGQNSPVHCGFPSYDQNSNKTMIQPGVVFKNIGGFVQPAKIGAHDFFLVGKFKYINKYLKQRENSIVIAQTLTEEGHWVDAGKRHVNIVVVNKMNSPSTLVMDHIRARIFEVISAGALSPENITYVAGALETQFSLQTVGLQSKAYEVDERRVENLVTTVQNMGKLEKINYLANYFQKIVDENSAGGENLSKKGEIIVTLTAYPPPQTIARAVCDVGNAKVTLRQIRKTIDSMLNKKGCIKFENYP